MQSMKVNILHRTSSEASDFAAFRLQQDIAHRAGVPTTMQLVPSALDDPGIVRYAKEQEQVHGDEIALGLHELLTPEISQKFSTREPTLYLHSFEKKTGILEFVFERFHREFGRYPWSLGSYVVDSQTLTWVREHFPSVKIAVTNCFEEGIHMFTGCKHQWYLFSEGGPWGAYYPSRRNSLCPAKDASDACGIVGVSHLNRDMLLAITSRDDYFSSHPANVLRGRANDGDECGYNYRFIDQWIRQLEYNGTGYYNIFVGTQWFKPGRNFEEHHTDAIALYEDVLAYLKEKEAAGVVELMTMQEYAEWHCANVPVAAPEVNHWKDILCGSPREMAWYCDPYFRVAVDPNAGGAISDLRPLAGQIERNMGPDSRNLCNGSYPFLISIEHRGGFNDGSIHTCELTVGNATMSARERRTTCKMVRDHQGRHSIVTEPVDIDVGGITVTVGSRYVFAGNGVMEIERTVFGSSRADTPITLTEFHRGCYGSTPYPEDMHGIELTLADRGGGIAGRVEYDYQCRERVEQNPGYVSARIPQLACVVTLSPAPGESADSGSFEEGCLFRPFYTLKLSKTVRGGGSLRSWLTIEKR